MRISDGAAERDLSDYQATFMPMLIGVAIAIGPLLLAAARGSSLWLPLVSTASAQRRSRSRSTAPSVCHAPAVRWSWLSAAARWSWAARLGAFSPPSGTGGR